MKPESNNNEIFKPTTKTVIIHVKDDRYGYENKTVRILPEQKKLLDWLMDNEYLTEDINIEYGYPEVEDLTK